MAIHCPNISSENYKALEKRVGERMAHSIWNKTNGQIGINGYPLRQSIGMMNLSEINGIKKSRFQEAVDKFQNNKPTDPNIRSEIFQDRDTISAKNAMLNIKSVNPKLSRLVDSLMTVMLSNDLDVQIKLSPVNVIEDATSSSKFIRGQYDPNTNSIEIAEFGNFSNSPNGVSHNTILHEIIHSITHNYIVDNIESENVTHLRNILDNVTKSIMDKYGLTKDEAISKYYGLSDISEFVSEGFVRSQLASEMLEIPSSKTDAFENSFKELYDWVSTVISKIAGHFNPNNIYEEFTGLASEIMTERKNSINNILDTESSYSPNVKGDMLNDIAIETVAEIKNSDNDYIVKTSAGDVLSTLEEDAAVGSIMLNFSDQLLKGNENISVDSVLSNAKDSLISKRNEFATQYNDDNTSDEDAVKLESQINSIDKIIDATAWDKLKKIAIQKMANIGVTVTNNKTEELSNDRVIGISPQEDQSYDNSETVETGDDVKLGEDWNNTAMFSTGDMDTSSRAIKMMMWSLRDPSKSTIGLAQVVDPSIAYQRVLNLTSIAKSRSLDGIMESINDEAKLLDPKIPNNMFRQLYDKLKASDLQTQVQFAVAMNRNRNTFIGDTWTNGYGILSPFSSESKNANKVVSGEWKSFIASTMARSNDFKSLFSSASDKLAEARQYLKDNKNSSIEVKNRNLELYIKDAFKTIGIELNDRTYSDLENNLAYSASNGYTFGKNGTLESQFGITTNGKPNGIFSALEQAFSSINNGMNVDDVFTRLDESAFSFLANIEAKSSNKYFANSSTGIDGNTHYNFGVHTSQTRTVFKLLNDPTFLKNIKNSIFARNASWLSDENLGQLNTKFRDVFNLSYHFGIRKAGTTKATARKTMALSEDILCRLSDFQNNGKDVTYLWDTAKSDKHQTTIFEVPRVSIGAGVVNVKDGFVTINKHNLINSQIMTDAFGVVNGEADRMVELMMMTNDKKNKLKNEYSRNYHSNGQFFYGYKFLNSLLTFDNNLDINPNANIDVNGVPVKTIDLLSFKNKDGSVNEDYINFFKDKLADYFIGKTDEDIALWEKNGLITRENGKIKTIPVNKEYAKKNKLSDNKDQALKHLALEFNMNSQIAVHNSTMLMSGDFAQMEKPTKNAIRSTQKKLQSRGIEDTNNLSIILGIDNAMAEYQKRLASDIAPMINVANELKLSNGETLSPQYNVIFTDDMYTDGEEYKKSLSSKVKLSAKQLSSKGSDALEFVSLENKLESLLRYGIISEKDFMNIRSKYRNGENLTKKDLKTIIIGAGKPLQVMSRFVDINGKTFNKKIYIKSAEMPLIKQITETINGPLDDLRKAMESKDNHISRVIHTTASKIGAEKVSNIYDSSGNIKDSDELKSIFKDNVVQLDWEGFGYQQDMPYSEDHKDVSLVTQADKTLFESITNKTFSYKGEDVKGSDLVERKHSIMSQLTDIEDANLDNTLGYANNSIDSEKSLAELEKVVPGLKWQPSDIQSARLTVKNNLPMMMTPISSKIESVFFSMYTNRVIKKKQPGGSAVQFPLLGKSVQRVGVSDINNIEGAIKTSAYNPEKGLIYSSSHDGKTTFMDIMMPFKFWNNNELLDVKKFVGEDGLLDTSKVPDEFLKIIGMRIPNQGHSSQVMMRIVGFLPAFYGDSVLVPPAITTQMGSDFDIDKLYMYWRNSFLNSNSAISKIPSSVVSFDKNNNILIDNDKLSDWRYENFKDKFDNKKRFYDRLHEIQELDKNATEFLNSVKDAKIEDGEGRNNIDAFSNNEITFNEAKDMTLKDLGLTRDDITIPSTDSLIKKALQDSYFELFESVLSDKDVIQKAMTPLDRNDLVDLADENQSFVPKNEFADPTRQALDYIAQSGAKSGVSIFSKVVPTLAMMESMDVHFITEEGVPDFFNKFSDHNDKPLRLYKINPQTKSIYTDPEGIKNDRTGIENEIILQTGSVDNANKPVLDKNNLNTKTFGVAAVLAPMADSNNNGISLNSITRFLRQDSIRKLSNLLFEASSTTATYEESVNRSVRDAVEFIVDDYKSQYKGEENIDEYIKSLENISYSPDKLLEIEQTADKSSLEYIGAQIDFLNMYNELDRRAWLFSDATSMATLDSNGMDINYWENQNLLYRVSKAINSGRIANAGKMWSRDGSMTISMNNGIYSTKLSNADDKLTASGRNVEVAAKAITSIGKLLGYNNPFLRSAIYSIEGIKGMNSDSVTSAMAKNRKTIANAYKSFVYANIPMLKNTSLGQLTNGSLANELLELKKDPALSSNLYVQTLQTDTALKYLQMNSMVVDNSAASNMVRGFYELAISDNPRYRTFAEDMIKYELLMGGIQNSTSSLKYIAPDILEKLGFHKDVLATMTSGITDTHIDEFVEKFYQNNPDQAQYLKDIQKNTKGKVVTFLVNQEDEKFGDADKDIYNKLAIENADEPVEYKKYFRTTEKGGITKLYRLSNNQIDEDHIIYDQIPLRGSVAIDTKGTPNFSDYSQLYTEDVAPVIDNKITTSETKIPGKYSSDRMYENVGDGVTVDSISDFLKQSNNQSLVWTGGIVDAMKDQLSDVKIVYANNSPNNSAAEYNHDTRTITIYKKQMSAGIDSMSIDYAYETLAHEINHAIQHEAYQLGKNGNPKFKEIYDNVNSIFEDAKEGIKDSAIVNLATGEPIMIQSKIGNVVANIPQNKVSGVASYGSTTTANPETIKSLGANPHSIDMIEKGFRTRTTRSESEMAKYKIKVGDTIKHFGKSADGTTKTIYSKVTAIHPKGSLGWKNTWYKEGWSTEDVNVIDRFKDGAAAVEFELFNGASKELKYSDYLDRISSVPDKIAEIGKIANEVYPDPSDTVSRNDLRLSLYSFASPEEFIADINSRPKLQQLMRTIMVSDKTAKQLDVKNKRSVLRSFIEQFAKLFTKLNNVSIIDSNGVETSQNSVLEAAFINSMLLVDKMTNKTKLSDNISNKIDISKSSKKSPYFEKDKLKFSAANKLIAIGSPNSSSNAYRIAVGDKANVGFYNSNDIVAISAEGNRAGRVSPDYDEIKKAVDSNVTFITDEISDRSRDYNIGERDVANYLESSGYSEVQDGIWKKNKSYESPFSIALEAPLNGTISEFLRSSEKDVRFAFRDAMSKGIFKTKC